jgi:hypothetical protein
MQDRDSQGYASSGAFDLPKMSREAKVRVVGRISLAELQARNGTRYKRKPKKERVPDYVMKNEVLDRCRFKPQRKAHGYTIIKLN